MKKIGLLFASIGLLLESCRNDLPQSSEPSSAKFEITKPGKYSLTQDINPRWEIPGAHHSSERAQILISCSGVELNLNGHSITGSPLSIYRGDVGIEIKDDVGSELRDIIIRNGVIQGFSFGIRREKYAPPAGAKYTKRIPEVSTRFSHSTLFARLNIRFENLKFVKCNVDFSVTSFAAETK